jgi:two-component system, sensor histidine kinase
MHTHLPFFNWSIKKTSGSLPDSFTKARVRIIYILLLLSLVKAAVVIAFTWFGVHRMQWTRAGVAFIIYLVLLKMLLSYPGRLRLFAHIMLMAGLAIIWSNIFIYTHNLNLPTLQFVFMMVLASFYTLGWKEGIAYSVAGVLPVLFLLLFEERNVFLSSSPGELPSPVFEIIIILNFITIIIAHYFFYNAFDQNIREKERLNSQLQLSAAESKKLAESRSNFLSTMSHELRTPLNSVVGLTELLLHEKQSDNQKENLDILRYSALDLLSLINNILDINKLDSDKLQLENTPFRLYQLINNICSVLRIKAQDKQLRLVVEVDEPLKKLAVISDPTRLAQVLYNLVGNAIKFTEKGNVTIQLALADQQEGEVNVAFSVSDTGIGIHPDRHKIIFDLFTQAESGTTRKYGGTGLGLAIVKHTLSLFNAAIQLESAPGKGSRFFFNIIFPVSDDVQEQSVVTDEDIIPLDHLKILVAEDNDVNRLVLQKQLGNLDIKPVMVADGEQAYRAYLEGDYDAIFLDLDMPGLDGYETTKKIRAYNHTQKRTVYLIAFTASVSGLQHLVESGFDDFLYKPVGMKDLREKLEKVAARATTLS